ncbi:MAG: hypothetical protein LBK26_03860 [Rickettsiales bacterium]|jgi:hypothetical protein|nr:hypothetical protein [Rickettsiales bacterium]
MPSDQNNFNKQKAASVNADRTGRDEKNIAAIDKAFADGRIDGDARDYLKVLYSDGMRWYREMFYILGKHLGAPKTPIFQYGVDSGCISGKPAKISDVNPASAYLVYHRFDADPMRNQFFQFDSAHNVQLSVSSIATVIIGAQKNIARALEKITVDKYEDFVGEVIDVVRRILSARASAASANAIADKIKKRFSEKFLTNAAEEVLAIIGRGHEKIAVELILELDKIKRPQHRLKDAYRIKLLFDMVPQARAFIDGLTHAVPEKIIGVRDSFFDTKNSRNYRDAKIILDIGADSVVIPMEIICQVRSFFDFESKMHDVYESLRVKKTTDCRRIADHHEEGIKQYNRMVCDCVAQLFYRVGWNILYARGGGITESLFDGFPKVPVLNYSQDIIDSIIAKLDVNVQNEVFRIENTPRKLSHLEEIQIFEYMTRFILVSAMPYLTNDWKVEGIGIECKLFNFVMAELYRYHKNDSLA